jgi:CBS domain-containing protein
MTERGTDVLSVADLMTVDPHVVNRSAPVEEAEQLMAHQRISGLPVIDDDGGLVGVVSRSDLGYLTRPKIRELMSRWQTPLKVEEIMTAPPVTVRSSMSITNAARVMLEHEVHRVVVVDHASRPIGVLSAIDFVELVATDA